MTILLIGLLGGLGAALRFVVDGIIRARVAHLPVGTVVINVTGSLLLGLITGLVAGHTLPAEWQLVAGTGFCGGYTTFSTASFETVRLVEQRRTRAALVLAVVQLGLALLGCAGGYALGLAL